MLPEKINSPTKVTDCLSPQKPLLRLKRSKCDKSRQKFSPIKPISRQLRSQTAKSSRLWKRAISLNSFEQNFINFDAKLEKTAYWSNESSNEKPDSEPKKSVPKIYTSLCISKSLKIVLPSTVSPEIIKPLSFSEMSQINNQHTVIDALNFKTQIHSLCSSHVFPLLNQFSTNDRSLYSKMSKEAFEKSVIHFQQALMSAFANFKSCTNCIFYVLGSQFIFIFCKSQAFEKIYLQDRSQLHIENLVENGIDLLKVEAEISPLDGSGDGSKLNANASSTFEPQDQSQIEDDSGEWLSSLGIELENSNSVPNFKTEKDIKLLYKTNEIHTVFNYLLNSKELFTDLMGDQKLPIIIANKPFKYSTFYTPDILITRAKSLKRSFEDIEFVNDEAFLLSITGLLTFQSKALLYNSILKHNINKFLLMEQKHSLMANLNDQELQKFVYNLFNEFDINFERNFSSTNCNNFIYDSGRMEPI